MGFIPVILSGLGMTHLLTVFEETVDVGVENVFA